MDLPEMKHEIDEMETRLKEFRGLFDLDNKKAKIAELDEKMSMPGFWDNNEKAQKVIDESNELKGKVDSLTDLETKFEDLQVAYELVKEEEDEDLKAELEESLGEAREAFNHYETRLLLSGPHDRNNAILELHPGAGGTEAQDWASMLLRMYTRWAENKGFAVETLDYLPGDEAGVKSVTLLIKGPDAFGYLKAEKGIHRLVRISPFDAAGRRHTSFVSCEVVPELDDDIEIEVRPEDLRVDVFRSSGAGGQHINKTSSAVRMTHLPTGIVVSCQSERSQFQNRDQAMKMLKSRLYQLEEEKKEAEMAALHGEQKEIGWGSQIRSYVFHPYSMVKDHRTNVEIGDVNRVMDGDIDPFIDAYLRLHL
ncbi:peptide chain release factor 2 [Sporolactobacillus kofuensis]|uniref:Peptide chain release factor 2 n=1 Tax=Sporolactobacillus kofuensis TaxID=269672 RepID=A0ABW1WG65_9BACL|nr:peptide chain release factor 2 [Sporolactobacillus kofuensis]MCO7176455.1 peptide chain release factor 2 [Sporolactobacillus kofuensis]